MTESPIKIKKRKTDRDGTSYFGNFLKDKKKEELLDNMKVSLNEIGIGSSNMLVSFLRVEEANAICSVNFKNAVCEVIRIKRENRKHLLAPVGVFFLDGMAVLQNFLDENNPSIPETVVERQALHDLLQFLSSTDHSSLTEKKSKREMEGMVDRLAQHLMIPLVPVKSFTGIKLTKCCSVDHPMNGKVGDTSFGCSRGWHGKVDILIMDKEVPISVAEAPDDCDLTSNYSDSSVEVKNGENFPSVAVEQMLAQAITFSFLQHKQDTDTARHSLVPGIGISAEKLVIHLYDCVEDVLLEIFPLGLFVNDGKELNTRTVIVLWLALNYRLFCSGLTDEAKKYTSNFHQILGPDYLEIYRKDVDRPMHVSSDNREEYNLYSPSGEYASLLFRDFLLPEKKSVAVNETV